MVRTTPKLRYYPTTAYSHNASAFFKYARTTTVKLPPGDKVEPITKIAESPGLDPDHLILYGRYKAKISLDALKDPADYRGKLVVVTGITPTPAGEGKTPTAIGITQGMGRLGHKVSVNLREPTLGPIFGIKDGG